MKPVEAPVPRALAATGHRGVVYRDPYGVAPIIGPFNYGAENSQLSFATRLNARRVGVRTIQELMGINKARLY